jgi:hypothetical protein
VKALSTRLPLTVALGGVVAVLAMLLPLEPLVRTSALIGAIASALVGAVAMVVKFRFSGEGLKGPNAVGVLMLSQGLAFMLRLLVLGVGAIVLKLTATLDPSGFVIAFFVVALAQQALEARTLLSSAPVKVIS